MRLRLLVSVGLLLPALSGCSGLVGADPDGADGLLSAEAALAKARELHPQSELVFIEGAEGPQPLRKGEVPLDDGADDGTLGDGLLSAWVVGLVEHERLLQVRIHADGRPPLEGRQPLPGAYADNQRHGDDSSRAFGSGGAAAIAAALDEVREHSEEYPAAGYAYSYSPYSRRQPVSDWSGGGFLDAEDLAAIGWTVYGNSWSIVRFDPDAWIGDQSPTTARAAIDAATGKVLEVTVHVPRVWDVLLPTAGLILQDPLPTAPEPYVHRYPMPIPRGTAVIEGFLLTYAPGPAPPDELDPPIVRLVAPSGEVVAEWTGPLQFEEVKVREPASGEWALEVTHTLLVPRSTHVAGVLVAAVPLHA